MSTVTLAVNERAFNDCVGRNGRGHAVDALLAATGTMFHFEVPPAKIAATLAALTGGLTVAHGGGKMAAQASPRDRFKFAHDALNAMAASIYAPKERRDGCR